jgi:hypothetical protein
MQTATDIRAGIFENNTREEGDLEMKSLARLVAIAFSAIFLTALTPAHALSSFGRTTVGTTPSGGLRADFKRGSKFVVSESVLLSRICAYLDTNGGGTGLQSARFALYRDRNGTPAERVLETEDELRLEASDQPDWYCLTTVNAPLEPGSYWIMIHSGGDPGVIRYYYDGPANWYGNADTFADGASDAFGPGAAGEGTLSLRVDFFTHSEMRAAGAVTVGTRVSSPMSAQMKRGSSVVMTEGGQLWDINVYVDGLGGATGPQPLWIALYDDLNGEPGALVARGRVNPASMSAGRTARWVTAGFEGARVLVPGRYWIALYTGGPAGVFRYYMQGTGNWRGNANPGAEPSPFFGAANTGDGTITANIIYIPENTRRHTFGRTTSGNIPSSGLTANYVRGSLFAPDHYFQEGWVTALWAYMDGNGGANGAQKVRLALYKMQNNFLSSENQMNRVVLSDEVTIPAGTPPGWVRFAVPYAFVKYSRSPQAIGDFQIMLFSSGTAGVARYYLSNDANNWHGAPVSYAAGAPSVMYVNQAPSPGAILLTPGAQTISMYAEWVTVDWMDSEP